MKNRILVPVLAALSIGLFSSCLDDEPTNESHILILTETMDGGTEKDTEKTEEFHYTDIKLMKHTTRQLSYEQETNYDVNVYYQEDKVYTEDTFGNNAQYTLNSEGVATECNYTEIGTGRIREFIFGYTPEGYLESIRETIDGELLSSTQLSYSNGNLTASVINGHRSNYTASNHMNKHQLPCMPLMEEYPVYFHKEALYAGLLGKTTKHLVGRITPENNDTEWKDYTYEFGANDVLSLIKESLTSTGIVIDGLGKEHMTTTTQVRQIHVTMK